MWGPVSSGHDTDINGKVTFSTVTESAPTAIMEAVDHGDESDDANHASAEMSDGDVVTEDSDSVVEDTDTDDCDANVMFREYIRQSVISSDDPFTDASDNNTCISDVVDGAEDNIDGVGFGVRGPSREDSSFRLCSSTNNHRTKLTRDVVDGVEDTIDGVGFDVRGPSREDSSFRLCSSTNNHRSKLTRDVVDGVEDTIDGVGFDVCGPCREDSGFYSHSSTNNHRSKLTRDVVDGVEDTIDGVGFDVCGPCGEDSGFHSHSSTNNDRVMLRSSTRSQPSSATYSVRRRGVDPVPVQRKVLTRSASGQGSGRKRLVSSMSSSHRTSQSSRKSNFSFRKRKQSANTVTTGALHYNRYQTSVPLGWFQQLHKCVCVKFVPSYDDSSLCHCGKTKEEHTEGSGLEDEYVDSVGPSFIVTKTADAIIKYKFENDLIESLFIRMDYKTSQEHLSFLLKQVLRMRHYKLFLHFLDFEIFKDNVKPHVEKTIHDRLEHGLQTLAQKTKLSVTSTGLHSGVSRHVHSVLKKLCKDEIFHSNVFRLACPPWGMLPSKNRSRFISKKMSAMKSFKSSPRASENVVMSKLSSWFNHYLLFDEGYVYDSLTPESACNASVFREGVEEILTGSEDDVNICVMMNGGRKVLDHVTRVMEKQVPVIVFKGTGGYADILAKNYMRAETVAKKVLDEKGTFKYRSRLIPPKQLEGVEHEDEETVRRILENNHLLTVFDPQDPTLDLEMVIYQALLKCQKESQLHKLLTSSQGNFTGSQSQWMDFLIEAMLSDSPEVVDVLLDKQLCLEKQFTTHRVIQLYNRRQRLGCVLPLLEDANAKNIKRLGVKENQFCPSDVRLVLAKLLSDCYPLSCKGVSCQCVLKKENSDEACKTDREMYRTCLAPVQELFLWTLLTNHQRLARVMWKHSEDKLASALVAEVLLYRFAENEHNTDRESKLLENAKEFGDLAVELLRTCYELDEKQTHVLMRKKSTWWGHQSVMELAYSFHSRRFISQPASMSLLDRIWMGKIQSNGSFLNIRILLGIVPPLALLPIIQTDIEESKGFSLKETTITKRWPKLRSFYSAPIVKHMMHVVSFILFLIAFSYVLLVDLQPKFTAWQGILCVWVASYATEEIRQLLSVQSTTLRDKLSLYWKEGWNQIDVIATALFVLGTALAIIPYDEAYHVRRVCLSIDFVFFCMRLLQAFSIGSEIGPMLTMILKMIRTTVTFVIILFVFMISYAVASESILFPRAKPDVRMMYYVPRKAYWQIYGEFFLGEIEGTEIECTNEVELYTNHTLPRCPTKLGQYLVPILLALYCIVTNVLLLNLLIAKFNDTYANVQGEAKTHWAWYRCMVFYEFAHRYCLPPPLNLITCVYLLVKRLMHLGKIGRCSQCCPKRCRDWWNSRIARRKTYLLETNVRVGTTTSSSIEVNWNTPDTSEVVFRYRILCYKNKDSALGGDAECEPDLAVTLYSSSTASPETYTVRNLAPDTVYRLVIMYETKLGWQGYDETRHKTVFRGAEQAALHEAECVDQLDRLQSVDPLHHKLDAISRNVSSMEEQFTKSINQMTGNITQLQQKDASVQETLNQLQHRQKEYLRQNSETMMQYLSDVHSNMKKDMADFNAFVSSVYQTQVDELRREMAEMRTTLQRFHDSQVVG